MRTIVCLSGYLLAALPLVCAADESAAPAPPAPTVATPPAETMAMRDLREAAARERAIWDRLKADPDSEGAKKRAEAEFRDVITSYENVIREDPKFAEAYAAYGLILSRTGNREAAARALVRANKLNPNLALVKNQLGNYLIEDGNYNQALAYYLEAIELEPNEPLYHYQLGALLHEFRRFFIADKTFDAATLDAKSHEAFRRAAELAPDNWGYTYRYAESFYDAEEPDWNGALAEWRKLETRAKPGLELQTVRLHIARVLVEMDHDNEARAILDTITEPGLAQNKQTVIDSLNEAPNN